MRVILSACALALASCQQQPAPPAPKSAALLVVHWADGGDGFEREYANNAACAVAADAVLHDYARRGFATAKQTIMSNTDLPAEPRPIAVCIPAK